MDSSGRTITELADDVAGKVKNATKTAAGNTSEVIVETKHKAEEIYAKAGTATKGAASSGKDMAAEAMTGLADAARQMAGKLEEGTGDGNSAKAAEFARKAADGMDRFSTKLREKEVDEIADDARKMVRQNPAIAVGAAAVIGFALARFLKGSGGRDA
ncbi:MAG: hypothetical protein ACRC1J_00255 [Sandaracinobacteroides sp.]